jgi:hypothetical protein
LGGRATDEEPHSNFCCLFYKGLVDTPDQLRAHRNGTLPSTFFVFFFSQKKKEFRILIFRL